MKFKHGDKVTCTIDGRKITDARISIDPNEDAFICQNVRDGARARDLLGYKYSYYIGCDFSNPGVEDLKLVEKTLDNVEVGDMLVNKSREEHKVLGVCGEIVFLSRRQDFNDTLGCRTRHYLKVNGWKTKQEETPTEELTMEELCKELGRTIKIKK
jgi:hypothetical protein